MRWLRICIATGLLLVIAAAFAPSTWGASRQIRSSVEKVAGSTVARPDAGTLAGIRTVGYDADALLPQARPMVQPAVKSSPAPSLMPEGSASRVAMRFLADVNTNSRPPTFRRKYLRDLVLLI